MKNFDAKRVIRACNVLPLTWFTYFDGRYSHACEVICHNVVSEATQFCRVHDNAEVAPIRTAIKWHTHSDHEHKAAGPTNSQCWNPEFPFINSLRHLCIGTLTIIGSDNSLSPGRHQAIIWTSVGILLTGPMGTNFSEILIEIDTFPFKKIHMNMSSGKLWPFCLGLHVLSSEASYRKFPPSLEFTRFGVDVIVSFRNLAGANALLLRRISNFRMMGHLWTYISRLRDFIVRFGDKTSWRLVNKGQGTYWRIYILRPGVGVTKPISSVPLFCQLFNIAKIHVSY